MTHIRRKFYNAFMVTGKLKGLAGHALKLIGDLFHLEDQWKELDPDERTTLRQSEAKPRFEALQAWLLEHLPSIPPQCALGKAFAYALNEFPAMANYLKNGLFQISNNWIENLIRPVAIGRKNWLFSDSAEGAKASAIYFTLTKSALLNGLDPFKYFHTCLQNLAGISNPSDSLIASLLPHSFEASLALHV
jgi:transposase